MAEKKSWIGKCGAGGKAVDGVDLTEPVLITVDLPAKTEAKAKAFAKARGITLEEWVNEAVEAYIDTLEKEAELGELVEALKKSTEKAGASIDQGLAILNATLEELKSKRIDRRAKAKPESWDDFFQQSPCPDFPTIEELRRNQGEDAPRESLDFSPEETGELFEKSNLLIKIEDYIFTCGVEKASEKLTITESDARNLAKGLVDGFSVKELQEIADKVPVSFKSPFNIPGMKTKTTTQDILDAVKDSRLRKGKE